jgi:adenosine deaminase
MVLPQKDVTDLDIDAIARLPKVDLHLHLDGSLRAETVLDLARQQGLSLPVWNAAEVRGLLEVWGKAHDLAEYLTKFDLPVRLLQTPQALARAACELVEDVSRENVRYAEVRFAPWLHVRRGMRLSQTIRAVLDGLCQGGQRFGVRTRLIVCCMRHQTPQDNLTLAEVALHFKDVGLGGLDLAGDEALSAPATLPVAAYRLAREHGLHRTVHAGEGAGPESIRLAIHLLGAERLGHGVRLREDPALMEEVRQRGIALEMCPKSNVQTSVVSSLEDHPLDAYLRAGLRVTVNTDNRRVSDTSLSQEYELMVRQFGWGLTQIIATTRNSLAVAFLPEDERQFLITQFEREWTALGAAA